jgi:hypothetical protein
MIAPLWFKQGFWARLRRLYRRDAPAAGPSPDVIMTAAAGAGQQPSQTPPSAGQIKDTLIGWVGKELAPWRDQGLRRGDLEERLRLLASQSRQLYLFQFEPGQVRLLPSTLMPKGRAAHHLRPPFYLRLFTAALAYLPPDFSALICVGLSDGLHSNLNAPIFCFQRTAGQSYLLLPDIDFLVAQYHQAEELQDTLAYDDKRTSAVFAGGTSGGVITEQVARNCSLPRLRAARFFTGNPRVDFRLPKIGRFLPPPVKDILASYPFCQVPRLSYQEQFAHKFMLSMDGNGATCQRVAVALRSNSVLVKYNSPSRLYYFHGLVPWEHFIPLENDSDIEQILDREEAAPGHFAAVAQAGQVFANTYLTADAIAQYTALLLQNYAAMLTEP